MSISEVRSKVLHSTIQFLEETQKHNGLRWLGLVLHMLKERLSWCRLFSEAGISWKDQKEVVS